MFSAIRSKESLKTLKWYDLLVVTLIMFGYFIVLSTKQYLQSIGVLAVSVVTTTSQNTTTDGAAYSSNLTLQVVLLLLALGYLWLRRFDFKQLPMSFKWSTLGWVVVIFTIVGLIGDVVTTLSGSYNYFNPAILPYISFSAVINKFLALSPLAIIYSLLNGFYEEFFFLGLMPSVSDKYKWSSLVFAVLIRFAFHTYLGLMWATVIGLVFGIIYYLLYTYKVKNLLPFFLAHALFDMFGTSFIYVIVNWG
ncbi:CPBP family intramembrane glutamic endopeptidase [Streptococcus sp. zg-JUN1979]|uniref:CPBP family intramembrane glutamic endopeptidase n=1 Tax=Streptococcus sp. zg-JUN1979 TaxID=3391450 RepID=UPI0039A731B9